MFTGIIEEVGTVLSITGQGGKSVLSIEARGLPGDIKSGDSIAVNGVCLTVTGMTSKSFTADAVEETLKRSTLKSLQGGDRVNLEYAIKAGDRLGGHYVQGHVDGIGTLRDIKELTGSRLYVISLPDELASYCIEKGSVALDGISLTIAEIDRSDITVSVIPHTQINTTWQYKKPGTEVNVEVDIIGKYVKRFLEGKERKEMISEDFLRRTGFLE